MYWNVSPEIFRIGPVTIRWYGLFFAMAFLAGFFIMQRIFRREGKPAGDLDALLLYMMAGTLIGARLGHVLFYDPVYYLSHPIEIIKIWKGGLASHGGGIGIFIALYLYVRNRPDQSYFWLLDRMVIPTALAGALIRTGNLFNSEIIGVPASVPWAVVFARVDPLPRHPAQLYEAVAYALIFLLLLGLYRLRQGNVRAGLLLGIFLTAVFTARFIVEFFKVRQAAYGPELTMSVGQWLSVPMIIIGAVLLLRKKKGDQLAT